LTTAPVEPAPPALCDLMAVMRHRVYKDAGLAACPEAWRHLEHFDLRRFCKLIWVMSGMVHQTQGGRRAPKTRSHYKGQLEHVAKALSNWPYGFRTFLADTYDGMIERSDELPGFRSLFNWLLVRLIKNDAGDGSAFDFLERELYRFGAQHWTRSAMAREHGSQDLMPERMRWGTLAETAKATGLHPVTLKKRIASGEINTRIIKKRNGPGLIVDMDSILTKQFTQYPAVSLRNAAPNVGVSIETLRELRANGVFQANYRSAYVHSLTKEDVEAFAMRLDALQRGRKAIQTSGVITLDETFNAWTASPAEKAGLLTHLLNEPSLVRGKSPGRGMGRLQIDEITATRHFERTRAGQSACLSVIKTAARLGCTATVVTWLKRAGHIKTRKHIGRDMPCLASVAAFDLGYEALTRTAARVGVSANTAYSRLDFGAFHHVTVNTPQYSTVFMRRADLPKLKRLLQKMR